MAKAVIKIEEALSKMKKLGSRLSKLFMVLFVALCISVAMYLVLECSLFCKGTQSIADFDTVITFVASLLGFAVYGAVLLLMRSISRDVALGRSPFTVAHARQIRMIAWLFVISFVVALFCTPDYMTVSHTGSFYFGVGSDKLIEYPTIPIDIKSILGAIVCFSLSAVWKYGALLQADTDDLY